MKNPLKERLGEDDFSQLPYYLQRCEPMSTNLGAKKQITATKFAHSVRHQTQLHVVGAGDKVTSKIITPFKADNE